MVEFVYRAATCGKRYERDEVRYLCPECGKAYRPGMPLTGVLTVEFDYAPSAGSGKRNRTGACSPRSSRNSTRPTRWPRRRSSARPRSASRAAGGRLDQERRLNPSGSLKDRASFLVVGRGQPPEGETIVTASTGNAASALAAVCAAAGKRAVIFVPQSAPKAKLAQMLLCGARSCPSRAPTTTRSGCRSNTPRATAA
jgi:threonine synthase